MFEQGIHVFFGATPSFVLVVAGVHASEQSGIEIAHWIRVKLAARSTPTRYGVVVVPDVFFARSVDARTDEWNRGDARAWREITTKQGVLKPARMFPPPGKPLTFLGDDRVLKDDDGRDITMNGVRGKIRMRPEIEFLVRVVELFQPVRIVSIHGKRKRTKAHLVAAKKISGQTDKQIDAWNGTTAIKGVNFQGVFVDPRYAPKSACRGKYGAFDLEACKYDPALDPAWPTKGDPAKKRFDSATTDAGRIDDWLALQCAKAIFANDPSLVRGNHVDDPPEVVHYTQEGGKSEAYSLGDWGPVDVTTKATKGDALGARFGAPVFTIETHENHESWSFFDGVQVVDEDGKAIAPPPTPPMRAKRQKGRAVLPAKWDEKRAEQLRCYADAIIKTLLDGK